MKTIKPQPQPQSPFKWYALSILDNGNGEVFISSDLIKELIQSFWTHVFELHKGEIILTVIRTENSDRSISKMWTLVYSEQEEITNIILANYHAMYEHYTQFPITGLFIKYVILPADTPKADLKREEIKSKILNYDKISELNLPNTLDLSKWGNTFLTTPINQLIRSSEDTLINVTFEPNTRNVTFTVNDTPFMTFKDTIISMEQDHFMRELENGVKIFYKNGVIIQRIEPAKNVIYMQSEPKDGTAAPNNFITLDLETKAVGTSNCLLTVISAVFFDGQTYSTYFLNDYDNSDSLILAMITDLLNNPLNHGKNVYVHNF